MKKIDHHTHILNAYLYPKKVYTGRLTVSNKIVQFLLEFLSPSLLSLVDKLLGNKYNLSHVMDLFDDSIEEYIEHHKKEMDESGIDESWIYVLDLSSLAEDKNLYNRKMREIFSRLKKEPRYKVFLGYDPNNDVFRDLWKDADGFKIYPSLFGSIKQCRPLFEYAESAGKFVVSHCSHGGIKGRGWKATLVNHPREWWDILAEFENLKVDLAHFGGNKNFIQCFYNRDFDNKNNWTAEIRRLMMEYEGVYADIAFHDSFMNHKYIEALNNALIDEFAGGKILFGTDFPLQEVQYSIASYAKRLMHLFY